MRKIFTLLFLCCFAAGNGQTSKTIKSEPPKVKQHLLGGAISLTDYTASWEGLNHALAGISLAYNKGLTTRIDLAAKATARVFNYDKVNPRSLNRFQSELDASLQVKAFPEGRFFNPFLTGGIGAGRYSGSFVPYSLVGPGLEVNVNSKTYVQLQVNYRFSHNAVKLDNNLFYSLGVLVNLQGNRPPKPKKSRPVRQDRDGDGVADEKDQCPEIAGLPRFRGCPDKDGDGIRDDKDQCPDVLGIARYKGCPPPDKDGDGLDDETDKCPNTRGPVTNQGCPEVKASVKQKLEFAATAILFDADAATIQKASFRILNDIVKIMEEYRDHKLYLEGHTDISGNPARNLTLSKERAEAVKNYLVEKGIDSSRIAVSWHGDTRPKAGNDTPEGRAQNRRVEMDLRTE
jgi:outer membrane protein OmpA-like peptidoglycan-associated protein